MPAVIDKLLRAGEGRKVRAYLRHAEAIHSHAEQLRDLADDELRSRADGLRSRAGGYGDTDAAEAAVRDDAFALACEAADRALGERPFVEQIAAGLALADGAIAEMATGEGKTLAATLPASARALAGGHVHVATANDYLAARDAAWMRGVYQRLGVSVGLATSGRKVDRKRRAYAADVVYAPATGLGFDYLRDRMAYRRGDVLLQRDRDLVIVDEVDSVLIDEARTPLVITERVRRGRDWYETFATKVAPRLREGRDYEVDAAARAVTPTEEGLQRVERILGVDDLFERAHAGLVHQLDLALRAKELFHRDEHYTVDDEDRVLVIDEHTGRAAAGRRFGEGLHQAIEAKEGVRVRAETRPAARLTMQSFVRGYARVAGMTGTARSEEEELVALYGTPVVPVPTRLPVARTDHPDRIYASVEEKLDAVAADVADRHARGQPVLVGTPAVDAAEALSSRLDRAGVPHRLLTAKNHFDEADVIAQAGRVGAVSVTTNMAGRGVDIRLGGDADALAAADAREVADPAEDPDGYAQARRDAAARRRGECAAEAEQVRAAGGLAVIGTGRHDARRLDDQLRGRSGRQGDPGESRFFLSLEDPLLERFADRAVAALRARIGATGGEPIELNAASKVIERAQRQVESQNAAARRQLQRYDDALDRQRLDHYRRRDAVLGADDELAAWVRDELGAWARAEVAEATAAPHPEEWNVDALWAALAARLPDVPEVPDVEELDGLGAWGLAERVEEAVLAAYDERVATLPSPQAARKMERLVWLRTLDQAWADHLEEMIALSDGIGLRRLGQRDPIAEYAREAAGEYEAMRRRVRADATLAWFRVPVRVVRRDGTVEEYDASPAEGAGGDGHDADDGGVAGGGVEDAGADGARRLSGAEAARMVGEAPSRPRGSQNGPCPCGSGRKHKRCCGRGR